MHKKSVLILIFLSLSILVGCNSAVRGELPSKSSQSKNENLKKFCLDMADAYEKVGANNKLSNEMLLKALVKNVMRKNVPKEEWAIEEKKIQNLYTKTNIIEDSRLTSTDAAKCAQMLADDGEYTYQITLLNKLNEQLAQPISYSKYKSEKPAYTLSKNGFPIYDVRAYCLKRQEGFCEQQQQHAYDSARAYWILVSPAIRKKAINCVDGQAKQNSTHNYVGLYLCLSNMIETEHMLNEMRRHKEPFHY